MRTIEGSCAACGSPVARIIRRGPIPKLIVCGEACRVAVLRGGRVFDLRHRMVVERCSKSDEQAYRDAMRADPCAYCGAAGGDLDHIVPRHAGGRRTGENETGTCGTCNSRKHTFGVLQFMLREHHLGQLANLRNYAGERSAGSARAAARKR